MRSIRGRTIRKKYWRLSGCKALARRLLKCRRSLLFRVCHRESISVRMSPEWRVTPAWDWAAISKSACRLCSLQLPIVQSAHERTAQAVFVGFAPTKCWTKRCEMSRATSRMATVIIIAEKYYCSGTVTVHQVKCQLYERDQGLNYSPSSSGFRRAFVWISPISLAYFAVLTT